MTKSILIVPAYEVLRKGVFERQIKSDHFERVMNVMCDDLRGNIGVDVVRQIEKHFGHRNHHNCEGEACSRSGFKFDER